MRKWIIRGVTLAFLFTFIFSLSFTIASEPVAAAQYPDCCTMWWKPCDGGGFEMGNLYRGVCAHRATFCDVFCTPF